MFISILFRMNFKKLRTYKKYTNTTVMTKYKLEIPLVFHRNNTYGKLFQYQDNQKCKKKPQY